MKRMKIALVLCALLALGPACGGDDEVASPRRAFESDVMECAVRMRTIYAGLIALAAERGWQPTEPRAIPGDLVATGFWPPATETPDPRLTCPGGAYAARDCATFPLDRFPTRGTEPLLACANSGGTNHPTGETNVLYADGSIRTLSVALEVEMGRLPPGTEVLPVGPGSPLEDLAKLER